jgi:hypothetical protein
MEHLIKIINNFTYKAGKPKMDQLFEQLKPILADKINLYMDSQITRKTKPRVYVNAFVNAFYGLLDQGGKYKNLKANYGIPSNSYCGYMKIICNSGILGTLHYDIITHYKALLSNDKIADTFTARAKEGSECKEYHHKEKGKKGTSVSLIIDLNKVPLSSYVASGNTDDREMLWMSLPDPYATQIPPHRIFTDKGYIGKDFHYMCLHNNATIICPPKRTRGAQETHVLSSEDAADLKAHRNKVEHVNAILRNFRSIDVCYTKKISTYESFVKLSVLLTTIMQLKNCLKTHNTVCT